MAGFDRFNLAVLGPTGVGKSTLVNAVFGREVAAVGNGRPVTEGIDYYWDPARSIGLYDFQGLETGESLEEIKKTIKKFLNENSRSDPSERVHGFWFCVQAASRRFDDGQEEIVNMLAGSGQPVFIVLTQVPLVDQRIAAQARELAESIRLRGMSAVNGGKPFYVNAMEDPISGTKVHGLQPLVSATADEISETARNAFAAEQRVSLRLKARRAWAIVSLASAAAGTVGLIPTPGPDAVALIAIQAQMMKRVSVLFDMDIQPVTLASALATAATTAGGRAAFVSLAKMIPGYGNLAAGAMAVLLTAGLGAAWIGVCSGVTAGKLPRTTIENGEELGALLLRMMREWFAKRSRP